MISAYWLLLLIPAFGVGSIFGALIYSLFSDDFTRGFDAGAETIANNPELASVFRNGDEQ